MDKNVKRTLAKLAGNLQFGDVEMSQKGMKQNELIALAHLAAGNLEAYTVALGTQTKMNSKEELEASMKDAISEGLKEGFKALAIGLKGDKDTT